MFVLSNFNLYIERLNPTCTWKLDKFSWYLALYLSPIISPIHKRYQFQLMILITFAIQKRVSYGNHVVLPRARISRLRLEPGTTLITSLSAGVGEINTGLWLQETVELLLVTLTKNCSGIVLSGWLEIVYGGIKSSMANAMAIYFSAL